MRTGNKEYTKPEVNMENTNSSNETQPREAAVKRGTDGIAVHVCEKPTLCFDE